MSLLGSQVYANPDTPCWVSANGDTITGNLVVTGSITAGPLGVIVPDDGNGFTVLGGGGPETRIQHIQGVGPRTLIQSDDPIYFTKIGQNNGNTSLVVSTPLSGGDLLIVDGTIQTAKLIIAAGLSPLNSIGTGSVLVGQTGVVVPSTAVTANSLIFFTRRGAAAAGPGKGAAQGGLVYNPANIIPGVSFQVDLVDPASGIIVAAGTVNADFIWWVLN